VTQYLPDTLNGVLALAILALVTSLIAVILAAFPLVRRLRPVLARKFARHQAAEKAPAQAEIPEEHIAAISAAIAATIGAHRIVRIEPAYHGVGWQAEGRARHHGSHALSHPGASHNQGNNHGTEVQNHSRGAAI
jgi:hypothetical protein